VEQFGLVMLDTKHHVIRVKIVSIGSLDMTIVHPREVFREAASASAAAVALFHNHPSGDPSPSRYDVSLTKQLIEVGRLLDIELLDHVVIGRTGPASLKNQGVAFGRD
jgi:DNA repair protein RadC